MATPTPSRLKRDVITKTDDKTKSRFVHWHHYHTVVDYLSYCSLQYMYLPFPFFSAVLLKPVSTYSVQTYKTGDHWLALPSPQLIYITLMNYNTTSKTKDNIVAWLSVYGHIATLNITILIVNFKIIITFFLFFWIIIIQGVELYAYSWIFCLLLMSWSK